MVIPLKILLYMYIFICVWSFEWEKLTCFNTSSQVGKTVWEGLIDVGSLGEGSKVLKDSLLFSCLEFEV